MQIREPLQTAKRKPGPARATDRPRHKRTSPAEIIEILGLDRKGISRTEIARVTGLSQQTVSDIVLRHAATSAHALDVLKAHDYVTAQLWLKSMPKAVKRGDHRPMRDALIATGVVAPDPQAQGVTIVLGIQGQIGLPAALQLPVIEAKVTPSEPIIASSDIAFAPPSYTP